MTQGSAEPEPQLRRWHQVISLLSMDVVRPFYGLMGLQPGAPEKLQRVLRQEIVSGRKKTVAEHLSADPTAVVQRIVNGLAELSGTEAARQLVWWEQNVFHNDPRDNLELDNWDTVLRCCRLERRLWRRLFPDRLQDKAMDEFRRSLKIDEYDLLQEEVDSKPLSDWDLHLYALNLYDDNLYDEAGPTGVPDGPRLWVKPTIRDYQGYQFWAWVLQMLGPDELDRLWQEGFEIVKEEDLHSAQQLAHPSVLRIWK